MFMWIKNWDALSILSRDKIIPRSKANKVGGEDSSKEYEGDDDLDSDYYDDDEYDENPHDYFQDQKTSDRLTPERYADKKYPVDQCRD